jgi:hypothetical protein
VTYVCCYDVHYTWPRPVIANTIRCIRKIAAGDVIRILSGTKNNKELSKNMHLGHMEKVPACAHNKGFCNPSCR